MEKIKSFLREDEGQGMVEYGLIIALIALAVIVAMKALGGKTSALFEKIGGVLDGADTDSNVK